METEEVWKDVRGYEGLYQVSNLGRVKSLVRKNNLTERILKTSTGSGYHACTLTKKGVQTMTNIHSLVSLAFLKQPLVVGRKLVIDHINGNKLDNRAINLRIVTNRFNCSEGVRVNSEKYSSKYAGVSRCKNEKSWQSFIRIDGEKKYLGSFINELDAAAAYQKALKSLQP
jgi:hypothetical protein